MIVTFTPAEVKEMLIEAISDEISISISEINRGLVRLVNKDSRIMVDLDSFVLEYVNEQSINC